MCHSVDVSVEAELGAVGGNEDGSLISEANPALYTDAAQAKDFVDKTGIDSLAVAMGNSHGKYKGEPRLDFDRLEMLKPLKSRLIFFLMENPLKTVCGAL